MIPAHVSLLPDLLEASDLCGRTVVVIDILRASTTMVHAFASGATQIVPCLTVEQALEVAKTFPPHERLLGGERGGVQIDGFDLGNSPFSYTPEVVGAKTIIFTTTNGTYALQKCHSADEVLIGSFVNLSAVVAKLVSTARPFHLLCAGTNRQITAEDILFAGAVLQRVLDTPASQFEIAGVQAQLALDFFNSRGTVTDLFEKTMLESLGGQNLISLGQQQDIQRAMQVDLFDLVLCWDATTNRITCKD